MRSRLSVLTCLACLLFACPARPDAPPNPFLDQVRAHFAAWDRDHDGTLSPDEIEQAVDDPAATGPAAAAAAALRRAVRVDDHLKPLTLDQLAADVSRRPGADPRPPAYEAMYAAALRRIEAAADHRQTFVGDNAPQLDAIGQGHLGDCFLLAALGTFVHHDPQRFRAMFQSQPDGTIAVTFGDGRRLALVPPTDAELAIGARTAGTGAWAATFEKAVGTVLLERQRSRRHLTPLSIIGVGGSPLTVLELLTGHRVRRTACQVFQDARLPEGPARQAKLAALRDDLLAARRDGRMMVGGTARLGGPQAIVPGLYYNHSYAVLDYDAATDAVTFWNPFGNHFAPMGAPGLANGYPTEHGRFRCPLPEAVMWFGAFSIETDAPLARP